MPRRKKARVFARRCCGISWQKGARYSAWTGVPEEERETASIGVIPSYRRDHIPRMTIPKRSQYIRMNMRNPEGGREADVPVV